MVGLTTKEFFPAMVEGTARRAALLLAFTTLYGCALGQAQVFTVEREHLGAKDVNLTTVQPTTVHLETTPITERTKQQLIRTFQADEAFAVRPLPLGTKGVVLHANGRAQPLWNRLCGRVGKIRHLLQTRRSRGYYQVRGQARPDSL